MKYKLLFFLLFTGFNVLYGQTLVDNGSFFNEEEKNQLLEKINGIEKNTSVEILVYTTDTLEGLEAVDYAKALSYKYPTGKEGVNNGIIVLLSRKDRKFQILVAYGMEWILSDDLLLTYVVDILPYLKKDEFYRGIDRAIDLMFNDFSGVQWDAVSKDLCELDQEDESEIIKFRYTNKSGKNDYKFALDTDPQFSGDFKIDLVQDGCSYELYYSKYMNEFVSRIMTKQGVIIHARLADWRSRKLELIDAY